MRTPQDYADNPFISALPAPLSLQEWIGELNARPDHDEWERGLTHEERHVCIRRLLRFFRAGQRQATFARGFDAVLREGYRGRRGGAQADEARQHAVASEAEAGDLLDPAGEQLVVRRADSSAVIGIPGMGKSRTVERVLERYRQVVRHPDGQAQITWLKLDCPPRGAIRTTCGDFFEHVDGLLGQSTYQKLYGGAHLSDDDLMRGMVAVANRHSLGYLILDEIQHLGKAGNSGDDLMTFLTTLINRIGVPVLVVGTMAAMDRFQKSVRIGRRMEGLASANWPWFEKTDAQWRKFVEELWAYQWTAVPTPATPELLDALYEETQGVVDFVTKLYFRVQEQVIDENKVSGGRRPEIITVDAIRKAAKEHFVVIRPMIEALKSRNQKAIKGFEDMTAFHGAYQRFEGADAEILDASSFDPVAVHRRGAAYAGEAAGVVRTFLRKREQSQGRIEAFMTTASGELGPPDFSNMPAYMVRLEQLLAEAKAKGATRGFTPEERAETHVDADLRKLGLDAHAAGLSVPAAVGGGGSSAAA